MEIPKGHYNFGTVKVIAVTKSDVLQKFASDVFQKMEDGSNE